MRTLTGQIWFELVGTDNGKRKEANPVIIVPQSLGQEKRYGEKRIKGSGEA